MTNKRLKKKIWVGYSDSIQIFKWQNRHEFRGDKGFLRLFKWVEKGQCKKRKLPKICITVEEL